MGHKILCCSGSLDGGGSERQLWQLACGLDRAEFEPSFYLQYRRGHFLDLVPANCGVHSFWDSDSAARQRWMRVVPGMIHRRQVRHLSNLLRHEQISLVYDRTFHMTLVTAQACKQSRVPRVSVIVSPPSLDFENSSERFASYKKALLAKAYADKNSCTVAVSEAVADDACKYYSLARETISVVPSPVDGYSIHQLTEREKTPYQDRPGIVNIAVVGRLSNEKGQARAIEALQLLSETSPSVHLHFVGDGPNRTVLETASRHLNPSVTFHGHQANPYPFIANADVVLIPSSYEGLPNVALEAMSLGTPVVATQCSVSLTALLAQSRGIVVQPDSAEAIAGGIQQFLAMPAQERLGMTDGARDHVRLHHSLEHWMQKMQGIFSSQIAACREQQR